MSEIKVGDLVMIVGALCVHGEEDIGLIGTVTELRVGHTICRACGKLSEDIPHCHLTTNAGDGYKPTRHLRKIEPLSDQEVEDFEDLIHSEEVIHGLT